MKDVAPHKVMVNIRHEPINHYDDAPPGHNTPETYKAMWANVQDIFEENGVDNVVWVIDYSSKCHK